MNTQLSKWRSVGLLFAFCLLFVSGPLLAQTPQYAYVSNSTATNSIPLGGSGWADQRNQWVYGVGDFGNVPGGMAITKFYLRQGTISDPACTWTNFSIKMGQPNMTGGFNGTWITGLQTVLSSTSYTMGSTSAGQWLEFTLDVPFVYDPTLPLVVETYQTGTSGRKTLQSGGTTSNMSGNTQQYGSTSAGSGTPRRYSYSAGIDLISLNIDVTEISFVPDLCQEEVQTVSVKIKNNDITTTQTGFWVEYDINGTTQQVETYTGSILPGDSAWHTFSVPVNSATAGNFTLSSNITGKTPLVSHNYTIKPSPLGSFVSEGTPFTGAFTSGDPNDPDIVAYGDNINFEINPPTGYNNSGYGSTWQFSNISFMTPNGTSAGSNFSITYPSGSGNTNTSYTPTIAETDSTYRLCYSIKSLSNGCDAPEICRETFVAPRPVVGFNFGASCEGDALSFTNTSTISSGSVAYTWDFGDGGSSVKINPNHVYTTSGTYTVVLTATSNYGYTETISQNVTVYENPTAAFTAVNVCEGAANTFSDNSYIPAGTPTYEWTWGDGSAMGSGTNPSHQYATPGSYTVTMKVTSNGCSNSATKEVTYAPRAVPDFNFVQVDCNNELVNFTNASTLAFGTAGYSWDYGDNTTGTGVNPKHMYATGGTFNVTMTATTDLGCVNQTSKSVTLKEAPAADFTIQNLCDKADVEFTNTTVEPNGPVTTYEWKFSDGNSINAKDAGRNFPSIGTYSVTLVAYSDNGCTDEKMVTFSVDEEPVAQFFANPVCEGNATEFQNSSNGNMGNFTSSWDFGGGLTSTDKNPNQVLAAGTHSVTLTVTTPSGCEATQTKNVEVTELPKATSYKVESAVKGDGTMQVVAVVTPGNASYTILWGDGGKTTGAASGGNIGETYRYISDGVYNVQLRMTNNGCQATETGQANVKRTALVDVVAGELKAYPNPNNGVFNLDLSGMNSQVNSIEIYAANGQRIQANTEVNANNAQIDMSGAEAGVYLIRVNAANGVYTARVTISK